MRREQNVMLQCIRRVVSTGFLEHVKEDGQHNEQDNEKPKQENRITDGSEEHIHTISQISTF